MAIARQKGVNSRAALLNSAGAELTPHLSLCERCYFHDLGILTAQLSRIPELVSRETVSYTHLTLPTNREV